MLILALIPAATLLVIAVIAIRTKHRFQGALDQGASKAEAERQDKLNKDAANDRAFIGVVASGAKPLGDSIQSYCDARANMLPGVRRDDPRAWTVVDLDAWLRDWRLSDISRAGKRLFYGAAMKALAVIAVAGALTLVRYNGLSTALPTDGAIPSVGDPLAGLPADPFSTGSSPSTPTTP